MPAKPPAAAARSLDEPSLYTNRELSWIQFNRRVLEEALDTSHPLLERVKFLSIFGGNLDEFFMIRVSGLRRQQEAGAIQSPPDGMTPAQQLTAIREGLLPDLERQDRCWADDLRPALFDERIRVLDRKDLDPRQRRAVRRHFQDEIFPVVTPLAIDPGHPFPHISNLSMNLAIVLHDPQQGERFARVKVPEGAPRLLRLPSPDTAPDGGSRSGDAFVWMEDVIGGSLPSLFHGVEVKSAYPFRITRDADVEIREDEASDLLSIIEHRIGMRQFGSTVRLEVDRRMPQRVRHMLESNLRLEGSQVYTAAGPLGLSGLTDLLRVDRPDLRDPYFVPAVCPPLVREKNIFSALAKRDLLFYHPYDSFMPIVDFLKAAARDPDVPSIKMTLYRIGPNSPIVEALIEARETGTQVAVLVELKARFDEENNIGWARQLESAGVHVAYGLMGLKTHAKLCLVVRREGGRFRRYVHLSTGNYNIGTARAYSDLGFLTSDPDIAEDSTHLFNVLTGYSRHTEYRKLLVAPNGIRSGLLSRIEREMRRHLKRGDGHLVFKANALTDPDIIKALYRASQAGVRVDLQIRGMCCLRPGIPGVSENIQVTSIVGRFLEHTRIYYFHNGGQTEVLMGSADLMPRNLDGRVEVLFPVEDPVAKRVVWEQIIQVHLHDNVKTRRLKGDGTYERIRPRRGEPRIDSQKWMLDKRGTWNGE
jgi:polyphosphate kinase